MSNRPGPSTSGLGANDCLESHRRGSLDTRSLRAPSIMTARGHLSPSPSSSGVAASGSATSALSASPEQFNIGRSLPSGGAYDSQGGAAARLKRVASNASIAGSIRAAFTSATTREEGEQKQPTEKAATAAPAAAASSALQAAAGKGASKPPLEADAANRMPTSTAPSTESVESAARAPLSSSVEASSSTPETVENNSAGSKRQSPPNNHLRAEAASRSIAKRRTWYGWVVDDEPRVAEPIASESGTSTVEQSGQDVEMADAATQAGNEARSTTPAQPSATGSDPVEPSTLAAGEEIASTSAPGTLKANASARGPRTSWLSWRAPAPQPIEAESNTKIVSEDTETDGQAFASSGEAEEGEDTIKAKKSVPAPEAAVPQAQTAQDEESTVPLANAPGAPPSWVWRLFGNQQSQVSGSATAPSAPAIDATQQQESARADDEMQVDATPATAMPAPDGPGWSRWIPYWGSTAPPPQAQEAGQRSPSTQPPLTPAEQVKAEALARPESTIKSPSVEAKDAILNSATRDSWISYFSNRNAARPAPRVESGEPEVMQIDFGDDKAASTSEAKKSSTAPSKGAASIVKPAAVASLAADPSSAKSSRPSTPRPDNGPKPDPAPPVDRPTTPLTSSKTKAGEAIKQTKKQKPGSARPPIPNLVLPTFEDTFYNAPRSLQPPAGVLKRTLSAVNTWLSGTPPDAARLRTAPKLGRDGRAVSSGLSPTHPSPHHDDLGLALSERAAVRLPRSWQTMNNRSKAATRGCQGMGRIVVIGIHGWFAQSWASRFMGEPTGTSVKFATEMRAAVLRHFASVQGGAMELNPEAITMIPLSVDGTVSVRVDRSFAALLSRREWVEALDQADAILFACHSQGCIVGTRILARLVEQGLVHPRRARISLLAMCGIHAGPFEHLRSTVAGSYLNYFENAAAKELFDFQRSNSDAYRHYEHALGLVLEAGVKVTLVASTDDQVVPLHSALFSSANHPSILRALYIHGPTFPRLDFLTNMLTFCVAVRNAGLSDHDLLALLSSSVAGSLYGGLGHSLCYEERGTYDLAARYLFETTHPLCEPTTRGGEENPPKLEVIPPSINTKGAASNPHLLPWSLRGILEDRAVRATFGNAIDGLIESYETWTPTTRTLRDVQYRLEPMRMIARSGRSTAKRAATPVQEGEDEEDAKGGEDRASDEDKKGKEGAGKKKEQSLTTTTAKGKGKAMAKSPSSSKL